ncbi:hypothetical protein [Yoonia litorea]|uniref:Uncharacterized protein n=1 Tax=Yoonia litorea TaxID=1123755 RepID=A0A1I6MCT0_9RHOB|nr:hypothetical protein [Yoonia litorea]SFS13514.1 hypothetical protein SAMN05444714_1560 [Yoonia litorea]
MRVVVTTLALLAAVILVGGASIAVLNRDIPDYAVPDGPWKAGTALDGLTFFTFDRVIETEDEILDALVFRDGKFQSAMCQVYCDFGWHDYRTFIDGETLHFTTTTRCPDAPHTVVFYGTVVDGAVTFEGTWTTRRWYWTHQVNVVGRGTLVPSEEHIAAGIAG